MQLPNLSYMMSVGELRYIQSRFEKGVHRNPDSAVDAFLTLSKRLRCIVRGTAFLSRVRTNPFYYYLNARTQYYDRVFLDAIHQSFKWIVNLGCGSDTRAHRFEGLLKEKGITVVEGDQAQAIRAKEEIVRRKWPTDRVKYLAIDLDDGAWAALRPTLTEMAGGPVLVMMEGVSPYVGGDSFRAFLRLLATNLHPGSRVAYDFKLRGAADDFGGAGKPAPRFRLSGDRQEVAYLHQALGFELGHFELGEDLTRRLQPGVKASFTEDCLVQLTVRSVGA